MDEAKLSFLFGSIPDPAEVEDEFARAGLLIADRPERGVGRTVRSLRIALAGRILGADDAAGTWAKAQLLLSEGLDRHDVMDRLVAEQEPLVNVVAEAYVATARELAPIEITELEKQVAARAGLDPADIVTEHLLDLAETEQLEDPVAELAMVMPSTVVHVPSLTADIVLTHCVTAAELDDEHLDIEPDLAGFLRRQEPRVPAGELHLDEVSETAGARWGGPAGWLAGIAAGALVEVRVGADDMVHIATAAEPVEAPELVAALRAAYDANYEAAHLPIGGEELVLELLHRDLTAFAVPRPPLTELAAQAGLERRGREFGHDASAWKAAEAFERTLRVAAGLPEAMADAAMAALDVLDTDPRSPAELRRALDLLADPPVLMAVAEELLFPHDGSRLAAVTDLVDRLLGAAGSSPRAAVARWLAAVVAERSGRVLDAESHLRAATVAAEGWSLVEDRLAWYESDRGDAAGALGRWLAAEFTDDEPDVAMARRFAASAARPEPGRNEPCWCGSGRKYKQCHSGRPALPPLVDRYDWLARKPITYLERAGGAVDLAVMSYAELLAGPDDDLDELWDDPLASDVALHEGGLFAQFLVDRGPLLPPDEAELAATWAQTPRGIHEIVGIGYGKGVTVRELRDGAEVGVTDTVVARASTTGELLCARVVPDGGGGHRFAGTVAIVPRGRETELREVLDHGDAFEVLDWLADAEIVTP